MRYTGRRLIGYDHSSGQIVRRKIFERDGREYVRIGHYSTSEPRRRVEKDWFCEHVMREGALER